MNPCGPVGDARPWRLSDNTAANDDNPLGENRSHLLQILTAPPNDCNDRHMVDD